MMMCLLLQMFRMMPHVYMYEDEQISDVPEQRERDRETLYTDEQQRANQQHRKRWDNLCMIFLKHTLDHQSRYQGNPRLHARNTLYHLTGCRCHRLQVITMELDHRGNREKCSSCVAVLMLYMPSVERVLVECIPIGNVGLSKV